MMFVTRIHRNFNYRRRSSLIFLLGVAAAFLHTLPPSCEAITTPTTSAASPQQSQPQPKLKAVDANDDTDTLSNEELHQLLGLWDNKNNASPKKVAAPGTTTLRPSFFPTTATPAQDRADEQSQNENTLKDSDAAKKSSSELIQSLNMLNALLGNPGDSGDVAATAAILNAASTPRPKATPSPVVKSAPTPDPNSVQSLQLLNSLLGLANSASSASQPQPSSSTGSAANLAAAAALLGLGGMTPSNNVVRHAHSQQLPADASAALLTNLILAQAGIGSGAGAAPYASALTQPQNNAYQDFGRFSNTQGHLDMAASDQSSLGSNQIGSLLTLLNTLGTLGQAQQPAAQTQSPLANLFNFGQQQIPQQQPDFLSALFGQDQKQKQDQQLKEQAQVKQQQMNSNILASLLGQQSQQQQNQNLLANLLAAGSSNSPLSLFGAQSPAPSLLSTLGTLGSSVFSLAGNTLSGLSGTRQNGKPRVRGVDTRLGLGYRLGPNADAQVIWEIGPQIFTDTIANEVKPVVTERPAIAGGIQKRFQLPHAPPQNILTSASQLVPRYKQGFRLPPHPSVIMNAPNRGPPPSFPHGPGPAPGQGHTPMYAPNSHSQEDGSQERKDSYVMLTAYEKWLQNKDKEKRGQRPMPMPMAPRPPGPPPPPQPQYFQSQSQPQPSVRRILHFPNGPKGVPPVSMFPKATKFPPRQNSNNRIVRAGVNNRRRQFQQGQSGGFQRPSMLLHKMGHAYQGPQILRPPTWPSPPTGYNYNPYQNFVPESDDSFDRRNAGVVDPSQKENEEESQRVGFIPTQFVMPPAQTHSNRRIASIADTWGTPGKFVSMIRGGIHRLKSDLLGEPVTESATLKSIIEPDETVPSLLEHMEGKVQAKAEEEEAVVKVGGDLSYEQLMDNFAASASLPKNQHPKIKYEADKKLELKPKPAHMKAGATDRPIHPPIEMFIDLDNGEVSVRKSVGSIDIGSASVRTTTTSRPKSQEELEDEESGRIFQAVQDHLRASYEQYTFDQELQKATKIHKEKLQAGLDDSMGLVTRYFDLMDATKKKRDVSSAEPLAKTVSALANSKA